MPLEPVKQRPGRWRAALFGPCLVLWVWLAPTIAAASAAVHVERAGAVVLGAATGFVAHETGHLVANVAFRNHPALVPVRGLFGLPFVAIAPRITCTAAGCYTAQGQPFVAGHRGLAVISAGGFLAQHLTSELLLAHDARPVWRASPVVQGMLAFNVILSLAYATTCLLGVENAHGDATGLAANARLPRPLVAAALITPAALDAARSIWPQRRVLAWCSWASKAAFIGLTLAR